MPGFMRKTMSYLGLVEDYDDEYDEDYDAPDRDRADRADRGVRDQDDRDRFRDDPRDTRPSRDRRYGDEHDDDQGGDEWDREVTSTRDRTPTPAETRAVLAPVSSRPVPPRAVERQRADLSRITTVNPRTYSDARTIGEQFREGTPVIMNLSDMDDADAKRVVDFSAGLVFGRRGSIDRVTSRVFLLSPPDVEVTAEDKARLVEKGFYNQS